MEEKYNKLIDLAKKDWSQFICKVESMNVDEFDYREIIVFLSPMISILEELLE